MKAISPDMRAMMFDSARTIDTERTRDVAQSTNRQGAPAVGGLDFGQVLQEAISSTNQQLQEADTAMTAMARGESVGLHETMISVEKADIALRTFVTVKNKAVEAYQEVMRMQL